MKDSVEDPPADGHPVIPPTAEELTARELAEIAEHGGAFDWIVDEPDLYDLGDGEPV
ncbi:MAG: hypothetical protein ACRDIY_01410 [Chloroflexota bacterium]